MVDGAQCYNKVEKFDYIVWPSDVKVSKTKMFFVPNCIYAIEERREEIQKARDIAKKMLEKYGIVTARIKQCVTVKCYSSLFPHDSYKHNAVKHAFEPIVEVIG